MNKVKLFIRIIQMKNQRIRMPLKNCNFIICKWLMMRGSLQYKWSIQIIKINIKTILTIRDQILLKTMIKFKLIKSYRQNKFLMFKRIWLTNTKKYKSISYERSRNNSKRSTNIQFSPNKLLNWLKKKSNPIIKKEGRRFTLTNFKILS